jgi:alpha-galactosidase
MHDLYTARTPDDRVKIAYVGGGSSNWAVTFINDLAQEPTLTGEVALYDVDVDSARRNADLGNHVQARGEAESDVEYVVEAELSAALSGADFVVLSTQDPPGDTYVHDLDVPREYGVYQTVGDTVGPGGVLRAMRTMPIYRELGSAIQTHCPDAWVINYTNPMTVCTRTLCDAYPDVDVVGLCHGVFGTQRLFASLVDEHREASPPMEAIDLTVSGINHFTWCTDARFRSESLLSLLDEELAVHGPPSDPTEGSILAGNRIEFDAYETHGVLPAISGRHFAEFVTWYLAVDDPAAIEEWGISCNESDSWLESWAERGAERDRYYENPAEFELDDSGEVGVDIVAALQGGEAIETNVNVPNGGQAPDLPTGAVVETNALVTGGAVTPLVADELPADVRSLVSRHVSIQERLVAASRDGNVDAAFRAFLDDPLVSTLSKAEARDLFVDMIDAQAEYLDAWDLDDASILE